MSDRLKNLKEQLDRLVPHTVVQAAIDLKFDLYAVGGVVRDILLDRPVGDVDFSVVGDAGALATEVSKSVRNGQVSIYSRFGTALVQTPHGKLEFATARKESYNPDSRKPSSVTPCSIEEDLQRRDFTINAMAVGLTGTRQGELIDLFGSMSDLDARVLRTPLDPDTTFSDDPLRMLRAVRFATRFGFEIDAHCWEGICRNADRLKVVAEQRSGDEFLLMLEGPDPVGAMSLLIESKLMLYLIPEVMEMGGVEQIGRHAHKDVLIHSLKVMQNVVDTSDDPIVRLSGLLHDIGKPKTKRFDPGIGWSFHGHEVLGAKMANQIGRRLRLGKDPVRRLAGLVRRHMRPVNLTDEGVTDSAIRRLMAESGEHLSDQLVLCRADITTANPRLVDRYLTNFAEMEQRMDDVAARDKMRAFQSPIRGEEIIEIAGIEPGPYVGALKGRIEDAILEGVISFEYESARSYLLKIKDEVLALSTKQIAEEAKIRSQARHSINSDFTFPENA